MSINRKLDWDGCINVRDLGGLMARDGRVTRRGAVVRSDHPSKLSAVGWSALQAHGIRTIISLRTHGLEEEFADSSPRPADLVTVQVEVEDLTDTAFARRWVDSGLWSTPLYYQDALSRWPERHAAAVRAVARAEPGGLLIHCGRGIDRTGIITMLLLSLAGIAPELILEDYLASRDDERELLMAREQASTRDTILATLSHLDPVGYLRSGGLSQPDLEAVHARLF